MCLQRYGHCSVENANVERQTWKVLDYFPKLQSKRRSKYLTPEKRIGPRRMLLLKPQILLALCRSVALGCGAAAAMTHVMEMNGAKGWEGE